MAKTRKIVQEGDEWIVVAADEEPPVRCDNESDAKCIADWENLKDRALSDLDLPTRQEETIADLEETRGLFLKYGLHQKAYEARSLKDGLEAKPSPDAWQDAT